ncbi:aspartyl-phosphate phosphatase Spo0E family protein [Cytobacillus suaedae]|nr:aspartyl-phosphate phosphatase Spo0E family protein [Cytobacillus suaedae]
MTSNEQQLMNKIEQYRERMVQLATNTSLKEDEVIKISCTLDNLLFEYQKLQMINLKQ